MGSYSKPLKSNHVQTFLDESYLPPLLLSIKVRGLTCIANYNIIRAQVGQSFSESTFANHSPANIVFDPLSAISLCGNIITFLDFGLKLISESRKIYRDGIGPENSELETVAGSLRDFRINLNPSIDDGDDDSNEVDSTLSSLLQSCEDVANELLAAIDHLKQKNGKNRKWDSFRQALSTLWSKEKLASMQIRLGLLQAQVTLKLVGNISNHQSMLFSKLETLQKEFQVTNVHGEERFNEVLSALESTRVPSHYKPTQDDTERIYTVFKGSLNTTERFQKELDILQSLRYESMMVRHSRIPEAHCNTFDWVFNTEGLGYEDARSKIRLTEWLRRDSGIFWVSGKPGSGKSTFMKYLSDDPRTKTYLTEWSGGSEVTTASFYFWISGTEMQKSDQGLLRSLLFEILSQIPEVIPRVCESRWTAARSYRNSAPWKLADLNKAFEQLQWCASKRFCFFIDGLDEYEGDHMALADTMLNIVKSPHIKACLSSRPWNCFEDKFGRDHTLKLYMQDLTKTDIENYTRAMLTKSTSWNFTRDDQLRQHDFAKEVVGRAQGVFLWVFLVVRSLRQGFVNGDSLSILQRRLRALPTDLEAYFEYILTSVDEVYREHSGCMLQVAVLASSPHLLMVYSFLDEEDPDFSIKLTPATMKNEEIESRGENMRRRIIGRTKGLLEITNQAVEETPVLFRLVEFLHRTVRDFLATERMHHSLQRMIPTTWYPYFALSRAYLAVCKAIPAQGLTLYRNDLMFPTEYEKKKLDVVTATMDFARRAETKTEALDRPLMRELELVSKSKYGFDTDMDFLKHCTSCGLLRHLESIINNRPEIIAKHGSSLLDSALHPLTWEFSNLPMVEMLLKGGANPNAFLGPGPRTFSNTVWEEFLAVYPPSDRYGPEPAFYEAWRRGCMNLMIQYGADVQSSYGPYVRMVLFALGSTSHDPFFKDLVYAVEILLQNGLDPNHSLRSDLTLWSYFLQSICFKTVKKEKKVHIRKIAILFLQYGADPIAIYSVPKSLDENQIVEMTAFEGLTDYIDAVKRLPDDNYPDEPPTLEEILELKMESL